jgi:hypothetical protein
VESILRNFVKQLASNGTTARLQNTILELYNQQHYKYGLSKQQCIDLIRFFFNDSSTTTVIIDGLDECTVDVTTEVDSQSATLCRGVYKPCQGSHMKPIHTFNR